MVSWSDEFRPLNEMEKEALEDGTVKEMLVYMGRGLRHHLQLIWITLLIGLGLILWRVW